VSTRIEVRRHHCLTSRLNFLLIVMHPDLDSVLCYTKGVVHSHITASRLLPDLQNLQRMSESSLDLSKRCGIGDLIYGDAHSQFGQIITA
jgi:hypothetical protein